MTTQRDRLAAVLHDMDVSDGYKTRPTEFYAGLADALLTRGVRVVDGKTLAAAFAEAYHATLDTDIGPEESAAWASDILAALDGEADQ